MPRQPQDTSPPRVVYLGSFAGENDLFRDEPPLPVVGQIIGGVYIPPDADDAEVIRLLETAARTPAADSTLPQ